MKEQHKIWQKEWRQIMGKPINVDIEPNCDFDLHFDIWNLEKNDFFKLFEGFPKGEEIAQRAYQLRWGTLRELNKKLSDEELIQQTKETIEVLQKIQPSDELIDPKITIKKGDDKLRLDLLSKANPISIEVDDEFSSFVKKSTGNEGYNAYFFLNEPMYRLSSSYTPCNWILWCLTDYQDLNPYTPLLRLYYNRCDLVINNDGILLFKRLVADKDSLDINTDTSNKILNEKNINIEWKSFCKTLDKIQVASLYKTGKKELIELIDILNNDNLQIDSVKIKNINELQALISTYDTSIKLSEL